MYVCEVYYSYEHIEAESATLPFIYEVGVFSRNEISSLEFIVGYWKRRKKDDAAYLQAKHSSLWASSSTSSSAFRNTELLLLSSETASHGAAVAFFLSSFSILSIKKKKMKNKKKDPWSDAITLRFLSCSRPSKSLHFKIRCIEQKRMCTRDLLIA